jgi:hypothetical protein
MVFKATFYYFSAISWWSALLVEAFGESHRFLRVTLKKINVRENRRGNPKWTKEYTLLCPRET